MPRLPLVLLLAGSLAIFGCSSVPEEAKDQDRWTSALEDEFARLIEPRPEVDRVSDLQYSLQGPFSASKAWISGSVHSASDDEAVNKALLEETGRAILEALSGNPIKESWVRVKVVNASNTAVDWYDLGIRGDHQLDGLAEYLGLPRK